MFRRIPQNVITRSYQADQKETIFHFRTFRLPGCFFPPTRPPASSGQECSRYQQVHIIPQTNRFRHIELRPKNNLALPPPPALFAIGNCLSHPLYLRVSVCLTLVQLGLVSP